MKTLTEHNYDVKQAKENRPKHYMGVACPQCGKEMYMIPERALTYGRGTWVGCECGHEGVKAS